jgi:D-arabinose 1-dehydrogenase-like Zn-dependent alcohol dehydrogenase
VLTPEGPTGTAIGQAVLDDQADRGVDDASCVVAAGIGEIGHVGVEILAALGTIVLRVDQDDITRSACERVAQIVECAACDAVTIGAMSATRTGTPAVIAVLAGDLGLGQVFEASDALGGVGAIFSGCGHGLTPGTGVLPGITQLDGSLFTKFAR